MKKVKCTVQPATKAPPPAEGIGTVLANFNAMSPAEIIEMIPHPRLKQAVRWIAASHGVQVVEDDGPEWARRAAAEFGKCLTPPKSKRAVSGEYQIGWMFGLVSQLQPEVRQIEPTVSELCETVERLQSVSLATAGQRPASEAADFFAGLAEGIRAKGQVTQLTQRAKLFFLIACAPREVAAFKSTSELHQWLLSIEAIVPGTDSRDTRNICKLIGLRYKHPGGRPRKRNPEVKR